MYFDVIHFLPFFHQSISFIPFIVCHKPVVNLLFKLARCATIQNKNIIRFKLFSEFFNNLFNVVCSIGRIRCFRFPINTKPLGSFQYNDKANDRRMIRNTVAFCLVRNSTETEKSWTWKRKKKWTHLSLQFRHVCNYY